MGRRFYSFILIVFTISALTSGCSTSPVTSDDNSAASTLLLPETSLSKNCSTELMITSDSIRGGLDTGDKAIDFTLENINGTGSRLSDLLEEKPVLLIFGAYT